MSGFSAALQSTEKLYKERFNPVFFILSFVKSFQKFPKHKGYPTISESFVLN